MPDLNELAERCEKATGPAFVLDEAIAKLIHELDGRMWSGLSRPYSASLDAAMTLVPEGRESVSLFIFDDYAEANVLVPNSVRFTGVGGSQIHTSRSGRAKAATPALALCAAALRATQENEDG